MYIFGAYVPVLDLLILLLTFVLVCLLYLAYEINRLKKLEMRLEKAETRLEIDEGIVRSRRKRKTKARQRVKSRIKR